MGSDCLSTAANARTVVNGMPCPRLLEYFKLSEAAKKVCSEPTGWKKWQPWISWNTLEAALYSQTKTALQGGVRTLCGLRNSGKTQRVLKVAGRLYREGHISGVVYLKLDEFAAVEDEQPTQVSQRWHAELLKVLGSPSSSNVKEAAINLLARNAGIQPWQQAPESISRGPPLLIVFDNLDDMRLSPVRALATFMTPLMTGSVDPDAPYFAVAVCGEPKIAMELNGLNGGSKIKPIYDLYKDITLREADCRSDVAKCVESFVSACIPSETKERLANAIVSAACKASNIGIIQDAILELKENTFSLEDESKLACFETRLQMKAEVDAAAHESYRQEIMVRNGSAPGTTGTATDS